MSILVILAHPHKGSFNRAMAETTVRVLLEQGHEVIFHDLYEEEFAPVLLPEEMAKGLLLPRAIQQHCQELSKAEGIVIIHPNWWGQPPAILKGWIDRVFRPGVAYAFEEGDNGEGVPRGLLRARAAIVFNTANTPRKRESELFGDPLETLWKTCIFELCGVSCFYRRMFGVVVTSTPEQRKTWLGEVEAIIKHYFPAAERRQNLED